MINITPEIRQEVSRFNSSDELLRSGGISIPALDRAAFGFSDADIKTLMPSQLNIKWKDDLANVLWEINKSGLSKKQWASRVDLSEPIEVAFEKNRFYIEDGHHRYYAAKILNKPLNVDLTIEMNPIKVLAPKLGYDEFHRAVYDEVKSTGDLSEEYDEGTGVMYGYHVTTKENLQSIATNGFRVGERRMQGKGFYAFYDYNHAVQYLMKGNPNNMAIVKFVITCKTCFLYLNTDIARSVLGDKYHLKDQIEKYFKYEGGLQFILENAQKVYNENLTMDGLIKLINYIETNNDEGNQRIFVFSLITTGTNDKLNIVWNGNYGLEYRINYTSLADPIGYITLDGYGNEKYNEFTKPSLIPDIEEYSDLKDFIDTNTRFKSNNISKSDLLSLRFSLENAQDRTRNNQEYNYYDKLIKQIRSI